MPNTVKCYSHNTPTLLPVDQLGHRSEAESHVEGSDVADTGQGQVELERLLSVLTFDL